MKMEQEIRNRLIKIRNYYGESVYAFAKKLNIPQPTLLRYENAERKIASNLLKALINVCSINLNWLITGEGSMFIEKNKNSLRRQNDENICLKLTQAGKRLVKIQEKHNFLDKEMAQLLKISEKEYIKLIMGELDFNIYILANLKQNFEVDIDELLFGSNNETLV